MVKSTLTCFDFSINLTIIAGYFYLSIMTGRKKIVERVFALLLNQHRMWGTVLVPYMIVREEGSQYYRPDECLSPYASPETTESLSEEANDVIELINNYSDRKLHRLFSREKTVVEFLEKVDEERFNKHIKPFIEGKLYKSFEIIKAFNIPVYRQKTKTSNLHEEDKLIISGISATPVFYFEKGKNESSYYLKLFVNGSEINLKDKETEILSNSSAMIRHENEIFFIDDIEGNKLKPFFTKDRVIIPAHLNKKYFSGFVLNTVNNNKVVPSGFDIVETDPVKKPVLFLEYGIRNIPVLILKYIYQDVEILPSSNERSFTTLEDKNGKYIYYRFNRDRIWEEACRQQLEEIGFYSDDKINFTAISSEGGRQQELYSLIEAVNESYEELKQAGFEIRAGSIDHNYNVKEIKLTINYEVENDWFDLRAIVNIGDFNIPFMNFRTNILEGKREYKLPNGQIMILPGEWFIKYKNLFELGVRDKDILRVNKQHFGLLNEAFDKKECKTCSILEKLVLPDKIPGIKTPEGIIADIRTYQSEGLNWLVLLQNNNLGGCLADDMGLGKTIQTLLLLQYNKESSPEKPEINSTLQPTLFDKTAIRHTSLLIVPASLVHNWRNEIKKFSPDMNTYCYKGNNREKSVLYFPEFDIVLSSYHTIRQDIDIIEKFKFHYIILDESQVIKNPASQLYKTVIRLKSTHKLVLTGTPVENSLTDLWTQLNFVNPGLLGNLSYFKKEFTKPIEKDNSADKEVKLQKLIKPFILRRTKQEVARDLPPVTEQTVYCDMTEEQHKMYEEEKSVVRNSIMENIETLGIEKSAIIVLQGLMKLRQISNHPVLADTDYMHSSGKFENVLQDIDNVVAEGHKILLFSSFVKHLNLFAGYFEKQNIKYSILTGKSINREKIVNSFQDDLTNKVFLISLKAGGVGLNLTSADYVFILDPWWNPATEMQALNRAHRIGQDKSVFVYKYISSDTIEEKIVRLQERKSKLAETFIKSNNPLKTMNIKDMLDLI
ncbi:MAG: DEAD/DEAH box helicase [Bacteroidales bacterium]|nr:DEAD/DEAH box helicase [Bacteroidales bacterium]